MITYVTTNLFTSPAQTLVNTVNTVGVMGKGIALEFKKLYPAMYKTYRQQCQSGQLTIGKLFVYRTPNKIIVNFPTKKHWRNPSKVEYIEAGLDAFVKRYSDYGITSVSFPQLGCGNGELDWTTEVKPLMVSYLKSLPIPVYLHLYSTKPNFVPERLDPDYLKEFQLEREIISFTQVWKDLQQLLSTPKQSNGTQSKATISEELLLFEEAGSLPKVVHRQDAENLWSTLRLTGTIAEDRVPEPIRADGATRNIFELLQQLSYIDTIELHAENGNGSNLGLQYHPPAKSSHHVEEELVV